MTPSPPNSGDDEERESQDVNGLANIPVIPPKKSRPVENDHDADRDYSGEERLHLVENNKRQLTHGSRAIAQPTDAITGHSHVHGNNQEERNQVLFKKENTLIRLNAAFQHHSFCKNQSRGCKKCSQVEKLLHHQALSGCISEKCPKCQLVQNVMEFHKTVCQIKPSCSLCEDNVETQAPHKKEVGKGKGKLSLAQASANACLNVEPERVSNFIAPVCSELVGMDFKEGEDYELEDQLGQGGNGKVYAIKLLPRGKEKLPNAPDLAVKMTNVGRMEISVLKKLSNQELFPQHFFIVYKEEVIKWKEKQKMLHHRMFIQQLDVSLSEYRKRRPDGVLGVDEAMYYWIQILIAVLHLHHKLDKPIIHKDIKSGNVLLNTNKVARLADFEYAIILDESVETEKLRPCGTTFFAAPEVKQKQRHGTSVDIYSMGAFSLELVVPNAMSNHKKELPIEQLKEIDRNLGLLMESCLQEDPSSRPTALELFNHEIVQGYVRSFEKEPFMIRLMSNGVAGQLR